MTTFKRLADRLGKFFYLDSWLFTSIVLLFVFSLFVLYSVSGKDFELVMRQLLRFSLAVLAMMVIAQISPHILKMWSPVLYVFGLVLLVGVLLVGTSSMGATRWLDLGIMRFQPSEIMKLATPMMVAWLLSRQVLPPSLKNLALAVVLILLPLELIRQQPDLGTALLVASAGFLCIFLAGVSWRLIAAAGFALLCVVPVMWFFVLHDYQKLRVLTFLDPESDPLGAGYHIIQSKIAIGSGGWLGKGWMNGSQAQLDYLPEQETDFIFAVISEEFGLLGVIILMTLYLSILVRSLIIAANSTDNYSRLLAGSVSLTFFVYVVVNMSMVSGLLPVVGVPLPLISYGGTSMVTLMASLGVIMSVNNHKRLIGR